VPRKIRRQFIDWRGIGLLVTRREFVDRAIGISGELLVTAGLFVLLFLGWHVWFNDIVQGGKNKSPTLVDDTDQEFFKIGFLKIGVKLALLRTLYPVVRP
jgi:hypothetical protein